MIKLRASKCELKDLSKENEEVKIFLEENHNQGSARFSKAYGLYYNNLLVQIMTFGKPRFNKNYTWEIIRDCTKKDYIVNGGVSKIWKHFITNNVVRSCICYSYPHNGEFTTKYIDFCGFKNIKKSAPEKKIYYEGFWNGEYKRIDFSILMRQGVDRLLKTEIGTEAGTNEDIILNLGFEKKYEDGYSPQVDSYFPFGLVYKIVDKDTGKFYVGETTSKETWDSGYMGSGREWLKYIKENESHNFEREILKDNFSNPKELYEFELKEIRKYCKTVNGVSYVVDKSTGCMNNKTLPQGEAPVCPECGCFLKHRKWCSSYKEPKRCEECGSSGVHKKTCSKYKPIAPCLECGGLEGKHKKFCSKYKETAPCGECGGKHNSHKRHCSKYKPSKLCPECGSSRSHKKSCSFYNEAEKCSECGGVRGHKKTCSKYETAPDCPECGGKDGHHRKGCSKYIAVKRCPECGGTFNAHYKTCSQYKDKDTCPECGGKINAHYKTCSHYVAPEKCPECGSPNSRHKKTCSHYKELPQCPECGSRGAHKSTCSHFRKLPDCPECGGKDGKHRKGCSKYTAGKVCPECGGENNRHMKTCSKYANKGCPECGSKTVHKSWCSKAIVCPECGGKNNRHKKGCSKYIAPKSCPECGSIGMHKTTCSHYKKNKCLECGGKNGHHLKTCAKYIKNR